MFSLFVFDLDGTLVDSESILFAAIDRILAGLPTPPTDTFQAKTRLLGHPFKARSLQLFSELKISSFGYSFDQFLQQLKQQCLRHVTQHPMRLMPGARALIMRLKKRGVPLAIATGNDRKTFEETAKRFGNFFKAFDFVITSEPEVKPKPDPEIYNKVLEEYEKRFGHHLEAKEVLVFEDTSVGVKAALSAGMQVIHVVDRRLNHVLEGEESETRVVFSLEELLEEFK